MSRCLQSESPSCPEGLEATMTKTQMADLITYVASLGAPAKPEPVLSARVRPDGKGIVELRASKCRFAGDKIEYMPDFDALGWWTSEKDRAGWTVVLDRPGTYRVEWDYSVSPESDGNSWQLVINGKKSTRRGSQKHGELGNLQDTEPR